MKFFVIYSFDLARTESVNPYKPPFIKQWTMSEDDSDYEYNYLADEFGDKDYYNGKHRKYYAELTAKQFNQFVNKCDLHMTPDNTLGSLSHMGHLPAFSFDYYYLDNDSIISVNAYVTPLPELSLINKEVHGCEYKDKYWKWLKEAMLNIFGSKPTYASQTYKNFKKKYE